MHHREYVSFAKKSFVIKLNHQFRQNNHSEKVGDLMPHGRYINVQDSHASMCCLHLLKNVKIKIKFVSTGLLTFSGPLPVAELGRVCKEIILHLIPYTLSLFIRTLHCNAIFFRTTFTSWDELLTTFHYMTYNLLFLAKFKKVNIAFYKITDRLTP